MKEILGSGEATSTLCTDLFTVVIAISWLEYERIETLFDGEGEEIYFPKRIELGCLKGNGFGI